MTFKRSGAAALGLFAALLGLSACQTTSSGAEQGPRYTCSNYSPIARQYSNEPAPELLECAPHGSPVLMAAHEKSQPQIYSWADNAPRGTAARFDSVASFEQVCLHNLGNPSASARVARRLGYVPVPEASDVLTGYLALDATAASSVQINLATRHAYECAVVTEDFEDPEALRQAFFEAIGLQTSASLVEAQVGTQSYWFKFDSSQGEALIVYQD
jgi:hypothetical protein